MIEEMEQKCYNERRMRMTLDLKNDIVFKAFFARKGNEEFLIEFCHMRSACPKRRLCWNSTGNMK